MLRRPVHNKMVQNDGIPIMSSKTSWLSLLAVDILQNVVFLEAGIWMPVSCKVALDGLNPFKTV